MADPGMQEAMQAMMADPAMQQLMQQQMSAMLATPEGQAQMQAMLEQNPMYQRWAPRSPPTGGFRLLPAVAARPALRPPRPRPCAARARVRATYAGPAAPPALAALRPPTRSWRSRCAGCCPTRSACGP